MRPRDGAPPPMLRRAAPGTVAATLWQSSFDRQPTHAAILRCPPPPALLQREPRPDEVGQPWPTTPNRVPRRGRQRPALAATCAPVHGAAGGCARRNTRR